MTTNIEEKQSKPAFTDTEKRTVGGRIKLIRKSCDRMTQQAFADACGFNRAYLASLESGKQFPSSNIMMQLKNTFNISLDWLLTGDGSMYSETPIEEILTTDKLATMSIAKLENGIFCSTSTVYVPISSVTACCGQGLMIYPQDYDLNEAIAVNRREVGTIVNGCTPFAVHTQGRSMEGYGIKEGSIVIVNPAERWEPGTVVMAAINEKASIKKIYERGDGIDLTASNGERIHVSYDELQQGDYVRICGKVMLVIAPPEHGV